MKTANDQTQSININLDQVILVDEDDNQIGEMDKTEAHRIPARLHRASSVLLHNSQGQWLIQQRSHNKIVGADEWANACCGNLRPDEDYEECAQRRLKEELGIADVKLEKLDKFIYQVDCNDEFGEYEMDTVFVGKYDGQINFNPREVQNTQWISTRELLDELVKDEPMFAPWTKLVFATHPDFKKDLKRE